MPYKDNEERLGYIKKWQDKNADKVAEYKRNWKEKNRERIREQYRQQRIDVLSHYSDGEMLCDCCGIKHVEFLCIDHIDGGGTAHRKSLTHHDFYRHLIKEGYPEGYRVLCHNCNSSYGHYGYCPHQRQQNENTE